MDRFPTKDKGSYLNWKPGTLDVSIDRTVVGVDGISVSLDAPLPMALDRKLGTSQVVSVDRTGRVRKSGVERLIITSKTNPTNPADEQHAWTGVGLNHAEDCWVRDVSFRNLSGSAVYVTEACRRVTVADCASAEPVSERGGSRRHTYYTAGQQTLFLRCTANDGRHDFACGYLASGPNAFVHCTATNASGFSGPIESWSTGVLYDNVSVDGAGLHLTNRETDDQGVGWAAANSVLWQCVAPTVVCRAPPTGHNWAFGVWGQFTGDGHWRQFNEFVKPDSLYEAQLADRISKERATRVFAKSLPLVDGNVERFRDKAVKQDKIPLPKLTVRNGVLAFDGRPLIGSRVGTAWWQGKVLPSRATEIGIGVTRFVPGREGRGFTDDLAELADDLAAKGVGVLDHHYGLWYDRRRDDHQMVRRADGDAWPPFYELPWARSGSGTAWDGLSKYDLTKFNDWYFARLREAADRLSAKKVAFVCQMYFQHNILEAGAHWADSPWRPVNCLQDTGFPEPPEYVGGKRIFHAKLFYDVSHPVRREMHRLYIRKVLDTLGPATNVIFQTSEEFTGPKAFVEFWLDTIAEWECERGRRVLVGLSATRDVQDAILADPARGPRIDVIDLKYWWYSAEGPAYDPPSSTDLAPRQQLREWKGQKGRSDAAVARQVAEYREMYPTKAVTCSYGPVNPWVVLAAGGSIPALPRDTEPAIRAGLTGEKSLTARGESTLCVGAPGERALFVALKPGPFTVDVSATKGPLTARWVDPVTGRFTGTAATVSPGAEVEFRPPGKGPAVLWLSRP